MAKRDNADRGRERITSAMNAISRLRECLLWSTPDERAEIIAALVQCLRVAERLPGVPRLARFVDRVSAPIPEETPRAE